MIIKPELPPKEGYVEVIVDGVHVYKNVKTDEIYGQEAPSSEQQMRADIDYIAAMMGVNL